MAPGGDGIDHGHALIEVKTLGIGGLFRRLGSTARADLLLYGHDGRGSGHVSRAVAVGLAMRRLAPDMRVILVTGSPMTADLVAGGPLDWVKLPSYHVPLRDGEGAGEVGPAQLPDGDVARLRCRLLGTMVKALRPRCVLVDHVPEGSHRELHDALGLRGSRWVLGVRAVPGRVHDLWAPSSARAVGSSYESLLWYGDSAVLGTDHRQALSAHFGLEAVETGYVCRAEEVASFLGASVREERTEALVVAAPWGGEATVALLEALRVGLEGPGRAWKPCRIFVGSGHGCEGLWQVAQALASLEGVRVEPVSRRFLCALTRARAAIVYAGYNTLTDLLWARTPGVAVLRRTADGEQEEHARLLARHLPGGIVPLSEKDAHGEALFDALETAASTGPLEAGCVDLGGAERAARHILELLGRES